MQTHLFHDRMLSMDRVVLKRGATLGPNSVILPAATLGRHATVGPVSLVMRGESVPDKTVWIGNPIGPWATRVRLPGTSDAADRRPLPPRPRRPLVDVAHYDLDLDYDLAGNRLRGEAVIDAVADEDLTRVVLDLAGLDVAKVTVDGRPPAKYATRGDRLVVTLRAPIAASARRSALVVKYAGAPEAAHRQAPRRRRLGGAHRRRDRGRPAARRARPGSRATTGPTTRRRTRSR